MPIHKFFHHYNKGHVKNYDLRKDDNESQLVRLNFAVYHKNTTAIIKMTGEDSDKLLDQAASLIDLILHT